MNNINLMRKKSMNESNDEKSESNEDNEGISLEESEKFLQVQSLKKKSRVPTLDNYSLPEFEEFKRKIMDKRQEEIPISVLETEISKIDLANLLQNIVGDNIIILMIKYLMLYQYQNKKKYNSQLHTKNEFFLLKIRVELSPRFKIKVRNLFGSKTVTNLTPYKSIFFIFKLDNRWMVTSYMPAENMAYIWDFLDPMFSNIPKETISSVVDSLIKKYLGRMKIKKSFVSSARNNFYSSKSLEILYVLATHFFDLRANPLYLTPDESTLSKFSKKLVWLIFGLMKLKTDKIYFLDFFDPNAANQNDQANQPNHDEIYNRKKKQQFVQEHNNSVPHQDQEQKRVSLPTKNSFTSDALTDKKQSLFQPDITNINRKSNFSVADKMILKNRNSSLPAVKLHPILEKNKISNMVSQLLPTNLGTFFPNINPSKNIETNFDLYKNKSTSVFQTLMDKLGLDDHNNDFTLKQADKFLNKNNETISEKSDKTFSVINFLVENPMLLKKMKMKLNQNPRLREALKSAYEKDLKEKILDRLNEEYNDLCMEEEMNGYEKSKQTFSTPFKYKRINSNSTLDILEQQASSQHSEKINSFLKNHESDINDSDVNSSTKKSRLLKKEKNRESNNSISKFSEQTSLLSLSKDELFIMALEILQKEPETRNPTDIRIISMSTEHVQFFQDYGSETHEKCCRFMMHEHHDNDKVVFELGSIGTKFYIILKGSVGIWVNLPKFLVDDETGKKVETSEKILTEVKVIGPGSSFGELALLDNRPRAATIKCKEVCEFAILDKNSFNEILKEKEQKKLFENIDFLSNIKLFKNFSYSALKGIFYHGNMTRFYRNQVIYKEGEEPQNIYIIKEGECLMSMNLNTNMSLKEEDSGNTSFEGLTSKKIRNFEVMILGPSEILGEEEILERTPRVMMAKCFSQSALILVLPKKEFLRRILCEDSSRIYMKKNIIQMKEFRDQRLKECLATKDILSNESNEKYSEQIRKKPIVQTENHGKSRSLHAIARQRKEDVDNEFLFYDELKLKAYEKRKALKDSLQSYDTSSLDLSQKIKQSFLDESMNNPYLKAKMNKRLYVLNLKDVMERKERKRQLNLYFRDNSIDLKREKSLKGNISPTMPSIIRNERSISSKNDSILFIDSSKKGKYYSNLKSFKKIIAKNNNDTTLDDSSQLPLKYRADEIIKEKGFLPKLNKLTKYIVHKRNFSVS